MKNIIKPIYFLFVLIFSGLATEFYRSQEGMITLLGITLLMVPIFNIRFSRRFFIALSVWLLYAIAVGFVTWSYNPYFVLRHVIFIVVAYVLFKIYGKELFYSFEKSVYYLSIIGLIFWLIWVFSPELMLSIAQKLDVSGNMDRNSTAYYNLILYTVELSYIPEAIVRNRGFTFEPGPYAIYLAIAILINLLRRGLKKGINIRLIVLSISLITTFSTTGMLALSAAIIYISFANVTGIKKYVYLAITASLFVYAFYSIDIFYQKIDYAYSTGIDVDQSIERADKTGNLSSGGRFGGFIIGWQDFKEHPLLGIGGNTYLSYGRIGRGSGVFIVNGIGSIMSMYGLFGLIVYILFSYKTSVSLSKIYNAKAKLPFFIVILVSSFGFSLHVQVMIFSMIFYSLFEEKSKKNKQLSQVPSGIR